MLTISFCMLHLARLFIFRFSLLESPHALNSTITSVDYKSHPLLTLNQVFALPQWQ